MSFLKKSSLTVIAILAVVFSFSTISFAKTKEGSFSNIKIDNFGQMDERFYRGGRPKAQDYPALAALGIKTIIDLTDNSKEYEQPAVEAAGLRYINIPMVDKSYPGMDQISAFLKVVDDPATGKFYVHCAGGRHRTGVMGAVYRFNYDHWNLAQAFAEMNQYEFGSGMGHGKQKSFVEDYWNQFQAKHATATVAATAGR
jgi:protein tyrosine/serine phosphatase